MSSDLHFAFDIGHSSIGWAVIGMSPDSPELLGCGSVIFPPDDCLASARRTYRRQRRHIRATRQRIERMARLIVHVLSASADAGIAQFVTHLRATYLEKRPNQRSPQDFTGPGVAANLKPHPAPWALAAEILSEPDASSLTWPRLWDVLRWYAHNRGYDGNRLWSKQSNVTDEADLDALAEEANEEDAEKVKRARELIGKFGTKTMAQTICAKLCLGEGGRIASSEHAYKTADAAFPRRMVAAEVRRILQTHVGRLPGVDAAFIETLCSEENHGGNPGWSAIPVPELKFPARYQGGLLFGQLVPRFDNRIIGLCPASGEKKPLKDCREYLRFRWAQTLANVKAVGQPLDKLTAEQKGTLTAEARRTGCFTKGDFKKRVRELTGSRADNLDQLLVHPEAERSLVLDPALALVHKRLAPLWEKIGSTGLGSAVLNRLRRSQPVSLAWIVEKEPSCEPIARGLHAEVTKKARKNAPSFEAWLRRPVEPEAPSGRAPYSRQIMRDAAELFLGPPENDPRLRGGLLDPVTLRQTEEARLLDSLTNNHLVRHRLRILEGDEQPKNADPRHKPFRGLLADLVAEFAEGDRSRVASCTVEVARDILEFSGKTNKEVASDLGIRLKNFSDIVKKLHEAGIKRPTAGLIRKARIADDMQWRCPYTDPTGLKPFSVKDLQYKHVDKDHIIPRSRRQSDSLDSLVITYPAVNRLKGDRTALQFMREFEGTEVTLDNGQKVKIASVKDYLAFVAKLAPEAKPTRFSKGAGHLDDKLRRWRRAQRMLVEKFTREDKEFTPADLTATSHLSRLAAERITRFFGWQEANDAAGQQSQYHRVTSLPGQVTAEIRKAWKVTGTLAQACPEVIEQVPDTNSDFTPKLDADGERVMKDVVKPKKEIRELTHLHHAVDAAVMAFASVLVPRNGRLWEQIANRKVRADELVEFHRIRGNSPLFLLAGKNENGTQKLELADLPNAYKEQLSQRLLERRVVQRVPSDMSGALLEETTWGIYEKKDGDRLVLKQRTFDKKDIDPTTGARRRHTKTASERTGKLVGLAEGKLRKTLGVRVIAGNFGVALFDPALKLDPEIIPHHQVWKRLAELKTKNGGKPVQVLKNGMLIRVARGKYAAVWRIRSCADNARDGILLRMTWPDRVPDKASGVNWAKENVKLSTLLVNGLEILNAGLTGVPAVEPPAKAP